MFCPLFRLHGHRLPQDKKNLTGADNEVWSFGQRAYEIIKEQLLLRERLRPYIIEQMKLVHEQGLPVMRPLFFDFQADDQCLDVENVFMFGPDILVAPIVEQGATARDVYLPSGVDWRDAWTGKEYDGGQWIKADAPLERIPLFVRSNSNLPIRN